MVVSEGSFTVLGVCYSEDQTVIVLNVRLIFQVKGSLIDISILLRMYLLSFTADSPVCVDMCFTETSLHTNGYKVSKWWSSEERLGVFQLYIFTPHTDQMELMCFAESCVMSSLGF